MDLALFKRFLKLQKYDLNLLCAGYCGVNEDFGYGYLAYSFVIIWFVSDFFEWWYHHLGHRFSVMWEQHRHHHKFFNPTPFAVIADEYIDQLARATPLLFFPMVMPCNIDLLFFQYTLFFYGYGTFLHWGYELDYGCSSKQPYLYTAYEHYLHHAVSIKNKTYHTGFFLKIWDQLAGTEYPGMCAVNLLIGLLPNVLQRICLIHCSLSH